MLTRKQYREKLNREIGLPDGRGKGKNGRYKPSKRLYGDYLYHQDREMFEVEYKEYIELEKLKDTSLPEV
jgi:hypothetical protein